MADSEGPVITIRRDTWIEVRLNRPDSANALNDRMVAILLARLRKAAADKTCRAVLLTGAGRQFCSGQDLRDRDPERAALPYDLAESVKERYNPLVRTIRGMAKPVVCAVNGSAAGAGIGLALASDIVLASQSAVFSFAFARLGLVPDAGLSWQLPRAVGEVRARHLLMTSARVSAQEALDLGLVAQLFADDQLESEARAMAEMLAAGPTSGFGLMKQALDSAGGNALDQQLEVEMQLQGAAGQTQDYAEGVRAFLQKRSPNFSGN